MGLRRAAITGIGVVSPLGNSVREFNRSLAEGRPGIRRLPEELAQGSGAQVGAMGDWDPAPLFKEAKIANLDRVSQLAIAAAAQALAASGLDVARCDRNRIGVCWGTGMGGAQTLETSYRRLFVDKEGRGGPVAAGVGGNHSAAATAARGG